MKQLVSIRRRGTHPNRSSLSGRQNVDVLLALLVVTAACSSSSSGGFGDTGDGGFTFPPDDAMSSRDSMASRDSGTPRDSTASDTGAPGAPDTSKPDTSSSQSNIDSGAEVDAGAVTSDDGFGPSRTACINKINALRATDTAVALQPYTLENTSSLNTCVDTQGSNDAAMNSAHYSYINNDPSCTWGSALMMGNSGQNECETGYGTDPAGIEQCLQDMWDERLQPNCAGCVGCTQYGGACTNCDFFGMSGPECGHYVNMSAPYYTTVACGFGGQAPSSSTAWAVQDFE
jgi:hypothetical protein